MINIAEQIYEQSFKKALSAFSGDRTSEEAKIEAHRAAQTILAGFGILIEKQKKGIKFIIGFPKDAERKEGEGKSEVQSVIFDKDKWSLAEAKAWLKRNDMKISDVDETENFYRFRQEDPDKYARMRTIEAGEKSIEEKAISEEAREFISRVIRRELKEKTPYEQAIAIAHSEARARGFKVPEPEKSIFAGDTSARVHGEKDFEPKKKFGGRWDTYQ